MATIDVQEDIRDGKRQSFVAVHEGTVLNKALEQCGRYVDERVVIAGLWTMQQQRIRRGDVLRHFGIDDGAPAAPRKLAPRAAPIPVAEPITMQTFSVVMRITAFN